MEEEYFLSDSCETFVLENETLISSFPGCVVFGKTYRNSSFCGNRYFKLTVFQLQEFFKSIVSILGFFSNDSVNNKPEKIIDISSELTYYWQGVQVTKDSNVVKKIKFAIEKDKETTFHIDFSLQELNGFLNILRRCVLSSLCLKDIDEDFIMQVIKNDRNEI
jgi:hypothetical protein